MKRTMTTRKVLAIGLSAVLAATALGGCSGSGSSAASGSTNSAGSTGSSQSAADAEPVVMDLIWWTDGNETTVM